MKKWKMLSLVGLSGLVLAACGDNTETTETPPTDDTTTDTTTETSSVPDDTGVMDDSNSETGETLSLQDAVDIYMREYPDAQIHKVDFDEDSGKWSYEIEGVFENREYDAEIDAVSGDIIKVDEDDHDDNEHNDDEYLNFDNLITPTEAVEIAKTALADDSELEGWELDADDDHNNRAKYDIEFQGHDRDVRVDAETGEVLEID
ncbi:PepSY domain-containing protein [Jeotgalibaca sp. A127]|uniref:PepSY domain-containing protein n=1 Tax=Jeotgalibaca sp. A127 TaxID=3457324 RepID=UPI003FCF6C8C